MLGGPVDENSVGGVIPIGIVLVAVIITGGFVGLLALGKATDGLEAGFMAVIGFFFGGSIVHGAMAAASRATSDASTQTVAAVPKVVQAVATPVAPPTEAEVPPSPQPSAPTDPNARIVS